MAKSTRIRFTKMHGLGNDFVVIDNRNTALPTLSNALITELADRHQGIGFDQLLIVEATTEANFFCRIYNADGSEATQCGNGLRCVARFLHEEGIHTSSSMTIATKAGVFPISIQDYEHICVTLGVPTLHATSTELALPNSQTTAVTIVNTGNPHAIVKVETLDSPVIHDLHPVIASHPAFAQGVNIGFMQVDQPNYTKLRTFERGAGETLACGSNACAAAVAGIMNGWLNNPVTVEFRCGKLMIEWEGEGKPVHLTGPATRVFVGEISIT